MSVHYPRRVKDLPTFDPDSEDDFVTPRKPQRKFDDAQTVSPRTAGYNKENEGVGSNNSPDNMIRSSTKSMYPKRCSELPTFESDSDEEESVKNDNLNCAILNDSFIISPGRCEHNESSVSLKGIHAASQGPNENPDHDGRENLSFILQFDKMVLSGEDKGVKNVQQSTLEKQAYKNEQRHCTTAYQLQPIQEHQTTGDNASDVGSSNNQPAALTQLKRDDLETPFKSNFDNAIASTIKGTSADAQFATPQVCSFSMQRRPRDLCSTQSQKTRSAIANEFRSQKVLFQTPMAMPRAPMLCLPNDSISLSLCDTINENTPSTVEKTPKQIKKDPSHKTKKSLEGVFVNAKKAEEDKRNMPTQQSKNEPKKTVNSTYLPNEKQTVLHINSSDYVIIKKLGSGGSSSVYLAQRRDNGKECALKVVDLRGDPVVVEGYLNETKLLAKLQGNICVVSLFEYQLVHNESKLFLVMEKGDSDLHKILQTYTTNLPLYVLMNLLYQMLQAVNYIHQNGVIHSDLKPANFLMVNGRLKLIDFGIASNISIDSTSIIKYSQAGTFNYISPEALTDTSTGTSPMRSDQPKIKISTKSDVWSLGCILYLLLYKKTPFSHIKNIYAKINAISNSTHPIEYPALPIYYPNMLLHMLKMCLQHNPKSRPSSAQLLQYPFNMVIPIHDLAVPTNNR